MRRFLTRLGIWLHWNREQRDLREEIEQHRALAGTRAMGNELTAREKAREVWLWPSVEALGQGLRLGARRLRRAPGFAAAAILTLALGIGASTAMFSVVESVLLHPLPYPQANHIVAFNLDGGGASGVQSFNVPQFAYLRDHLQGLSAIGLYTGGVTTELQASGRTVWASIAAASDGFFPSFGVAPRLGRDFTRADTATGAPSVVILSHALWQRAFNSDPNVLGRTIAIHREPATIIGVLPASFHFLEYPVDLYEAYPVEADMHDDGLNESIVARLAPGFSLRQLQTQLPTLAPQLKAAHLLPPWSTGVSAAGYQALETAPVATPIWLLLAGAGLLLLIAGANVAGLILARALARRPEIAMRRALGASRPRLLLQFIGEAAVLASAAALAGLALAEIFVRAMASTLPAELPLAVPVSLDARVVAFDLLVALAASLAFALASATALRHRPLTVTRFARRAWSRDLIVVAEVSLTLVLLAAAALLLQSLRRISQQPLGFDPAGRTLFTTQLPAPANGATAQPLHFDGYWDFDQAVLDRLNALPGVQAAAVNVPPLAGQNNLPGESVLDPQLAASLELREVSPDYFSVMAMPLLRGRGLNPSDTAASATVAVVSQSLATKWFGGRALGQQIRMGAYRGKIYSPTLAAKPLTVVGVVGDVKVEDVRRPSRLTVYTPAAQWTSGATAWVARGPLTESQIRVAVAAANPAARLGDIEPYSTLIASTLTQPHLEALLASAFAALACVLTAVGLFGLLASTVAERTREIGVRMALGARSARLAWSVAARGLALTAAGLVVGLAASRAAAPLLASQLFGVTPGNLAAPVLAALAMLAVAALACYLPARRATQIDPVSALRLE